MILNKIIIENFRSFLGVHEIVFHQNSLTVVQGSNLDTQGESASGKSSLLLAISYGLGICPFSAKDLQNWNTEEAMQITLFLEVNNEEIVLKRGKTNSVSTSEKIITGAKEIESYLQNLTHLSSDQLAFVIYKEQGGNDYFLEKTNSDKRDFLSNVLNLEEYELEIIKSNEECNTLNTKLIQQKSILDVYSKQKEDIYKEEDKLKLIQINEPLNVDYLKEAISAWTSDITKEQILLSSTQDSIALEQNRYKIKLNELEKELNKEDNECRKIKIKIYNTQEERLRLMAIKGTIVIRVKETQDKAKSLNKDFNTLEKVNDTIIQQEALKASLLKGECLTCNQSWVSVEKLNEIESLLEALRQNKKELDSRLLELPILENKTNELNAFHTKTDKEMTDQFNLENELNKELNALLKKKNTDYVEDCKAVTKEQAEIEIPLTAIRSKIDSLNYKIKNAQIQITEADKKNTEINNRIAQIETTQTLLDQRFDKLVDEINKAEYEISCIQFEIGYFKDRIDLIKGFLTFITVDILNEIAAEANEYLRSIPNVESISISFEPEKTTTKGTIKQEVTSIITVNGLPRSFKSGCSGGQQTALKLSVELALRNVIQRRSGRTWGLFILDEGMNGLDLSSKNACLSILSKFADNHLVLLVDHHSELNAGAVNTIMVTSKDGASSIA